MDRGTWRAKVHGVKSDMTERLTFSRYLRNEEGQRWERLVNEPWEGREFLLCVAVNFQRRLASSSARKSSSSMVARLRFLRMSWVPGSFYLLSSPEELPTSSCLKLTVHDQIFMVVLLEGEPLPGLETGLMSNTRNELSKETRELTKQETIGKGRPGREQEHKGTQEDCSATWLEGSGFTVMGFISGFSLPHH